MKKMVAILLVLSLMLAMLTACGSSSQTEETSDSDVSESSETEVEETEETQSEVDETEVEEDALEVEQAEEKVETVNFTFSTNNNETSTAGQYIKAWTEKVNEITNGEVEFTVYYSGALVSEDDIIESIKSGLCDAGEVAWSKQANSLPMSSILIMPFSDLGNGATFYENVFLPLMNDYIELEEEYDGLNIISLYVTETSAALHTNGAEVRVPSDLSGLIIAAQSANQSQLTIDAGGAPISADLADWYSNLERGLMDGLWMSWGPISGMELYKVLTSHTIFPSGYDRPITTFLMSDAAWNKLSSNAQEALSSVSFMEWCAETWIEIDQADFAETREIVEANGNTIIELTDGEEAQWMELAKSTNDAYLQEYDDMGYPATEFYNSFQEYCKTNR